MTLSGVHRGIRVARYNTHHPGEWIAGLVIYGLLALLRLAWWILRQAWHRPVAAAAVCVSLLALLEVGQVMALATFTTLTCAAVTFKVRRFATSAGGARTPLRILSDLSSLSVRTWRLKRSWAFAATNIKLQHQAAQVPPRLHRVTWHSPTRVSAVVSLSGTGKSLDQLTSEHLAVLASELRLRRVTVEPIKGRPGLVGFMFHWGSPLDDVLGLEKLPTPRPGWAMFGLSENDDPIGLPLRYSTLLVGASRSGKSSTVWAMVCSALEQANLPDGDPVQFWVIDQSQTEFASIEGLAHQYARGQNQAIGLLRALWDECSRRAKLMGEDSQRVLKPTVETPRIVLIVDEMLFLISKKLEPKMGRTADGLLFMLLTQAAKYGIVVWCGTQAGKVNVVGDNRDFFQQRLCHKSSHKEMTDCALGDRAAAQGADCHKLVVPQDAGIGWIRNHDRSGYQQFRSVFVEDPDVHQIGRGQLPQRLLLARGEIPAADLRPGAVYIMWSHTDDRGREECLYVGQTCEDNPQDRWGDHLFRADGTPKSTTKPWAHLVGRVEVKDLGTQRRAIREERRLIRKYNPRFNDVLYINEPETVDAR